MSSDLDSVSSLNTTTVIIDHLGNPLSVDKNPAHFEGFLLEVEQFIARTGHFQPLLENRAVCTSAGKTVVDSVSAVPFVENSVAGAKVYDLFDPCPSTAARITAYNVAATAASTPTHKAWALWRRSCMGR